MRFGERPLVRHAGHGGGRVGVTIVELLVVITLLLMITAVTVPTIAPAIQQRRVREAARLTSSYIAAARARAMETQGTQVDWAVFQQQLQTYGQQMAGELESKLDGPSYEAILRNGILPFAGP